MLSLRRHSECFRSRWPAGASRGRPLSSLDHPRRGRAYLVTPLPTRYVTVDAHRTPRESYRFDPFGPSRWRPVSSEGPIEIDVIPSAPEPGGAGRWPAFQDGTTTLVTFLYHFHWTYTGILPRDRYLPPRPLSHTYTRPIRLKWMFLARLLSPFLHYLRTRSKVSPT